MKKILTILTIATTLILTACGDSKPVYDFSSEESTKASFIEQGKKEGFSENEVFRIFKKYNKCIDSKYKAELEETLKKGGTHDDFMKKVTQGVTFTEMKKIAEEELNEKI